MSSELDRAREALEQFTAETRKILSDRILGKRKSAPMNRVLPGAAMHLRVALTEVDRLTAALAEAEAEATIANERSASEQRDTEAWTRGFFTALATHADDTGREDGIAATDIRTVEQAVKAGVEAQDAVKLRSRFACVRSREQDQQARRARRAATKEAP